jgi:hypothetical protein
MARPSPKLFPQKKEEEVLLLIFYFFSFDPLNFFFFNLAPQSLKAGSAPASYHVFSLDLNYLLSRFIPNPYHHNGFFYWL